MDTILHCGNPEDFEDIILKHLSDNNDTDFRSCLYKIVAELAPSWSEDGIRQLKEVAKNDIITSDNSFQRDNKRKELSAFVVEVLEQFQ